MKKTIAVLLIALVCVTGAFALDMSIGGETGFGQQYIFSTVNVTESIIPVNVDFLMSLEDAPVSFKIDLGTEFKPSTMFEKTYAYFDLAAAAYYRYEATRDLDILAGLGLKWEVTGLEGGVSNNILVLYCDGEVRYDVAKNVEIFGGLEVGGQLIDKLVGNSVTLDRHDGSGIRWGISAGAAYKF